MWFKNLRVYKLTEAISAEVDLSNVLAEYHFNPCGSLDPKRYGFVPPIPNRIAFTHKVFGFTMFCARLEEKLLPSAAINAQLEEKARAIGEAESRPVGRKERQTLRDELIFSMLPKAFSKFTLDYAYIDHKGGFIVVNSSSAKRAEDLLSKLREALGSLRCIPITVKNLPSQVMTSWLQGGKLLENFVLGENIELKAGKDGRVVRAKKQDLTANEVLAHINSGMYVSKLALTWREGIHFVLDDTLAIKSVKFDDVISEKSNDRNPESKPEQFDADFCVMTAQLTPFINELIAAFGGETDPV